MAFIEVDYDFYANNFKGTAIPAESFDKKSIESEALVNQITFNRIRKYSLTKEDLHLVKMAICAVADVYHEQEQHKGIKSENNDGYSVTYTDGDVETMRNNAVAAADIYLSGTTLRNRMMSYDYQY